MSTSDVLPLSNPSPASSTGAALPLGIIVVLAVSCGIISQTGAPGSALALPAAAALGLALFHREGLACPGSLVSLTAALLALAGMLLQPGPLNIMFFWLSVAALTLNLRHRQVFPWQIAALLPALDSLASSPARAGHLLRIQRATLTFIDDHPRLLTLANFLLPVIAVVVFGWLLTAANPVLEQALLSISWNGPRDLLLSWTPAASLIAFLLMISALLVIPATHVPALDLPQVERAWRRKFLTTHSLVITLGLLNAMFLAENLLDLRYIWLEGVLPEGMTYAAYVHRGSYTLIVTAMLAGAFVIHAFRPGSPAEASRMLRVLIYSWVLQNVMLVASSAARTLMYIDAYGMTMWRLSGLIWMAMVAGGLLLIAARILFKRGNGWLLDRNLAMAFCVLLASGLADYRAMVAHWNVTRYLEHRSAGIFQPATVDLFYLGLLGPSSLPALDRLETALSPTLPGPPHHHPYDQTVLDVARAVRSRLTWAAAPLQADWRSWSVLNHIYLNRP